MSADTESLSSLENLLNEFFHGETVNDRKRQIEDILNNFCLQDGAWRQCIFFLNNTSNDYVLMYSLSIFETIVTQRWHGTQGNDKQHIRKFLYDYLMTHYIKVPAFIRNKLIKVLVNIGRYDWPMFYPMFFSNIMQLLQNGDTTLLGVIALQMVSEEFISPREDLSMSRRLELRECLLQHLPSALETLTELLNTILMKFKRVTQTVTPPPSPNDQSSHQSSSHHTTTIIGVENSAANTPLDRNTEELCTNIFTCLAQYISWLPLSRFITPALVGKIFSFAEFACRISSNATIKDSSCQIGVYAMSCINEILAKKFVPAEYEAFLLQMFQQTFNLLQIISKGAPQMTVHALENLDDNYIDKFTEFLNLFVGNHFKRFEPNHHFPTVELLYLLLKYTMVQKNVEMFVSCLDIWNIVLDYLIDNVTSCITVNFKTAAIKKYRQCLIDLLIDLLKKLQFRANEDWLSEINMDKLNADNETEWEMFLKPCIDIVEKLSILVPEETFSNCSEIFKGNVDVYFGISVVINDNSLQVPNENLKNMHISMLDLSTFFRIMGRLSSLFTDEVNFDNRLDQCKTLIKLLIRGAMFGSFYKTYSLTVQNQISDDLVEVHSQAIACVQAYSYWLSKCNTICQNEHLLAEEFRSIIASILEVISSLFTSGIPIKISTASAHLLLSITSTVRPTFFLVIEQGQKIFKDHEKLLECPIDIQVLVFRALSDVLILPWASIGDASQNWEARTNSHKDLTSSLCKTLVGIPDASILSNNLQEHTKWKNIIKHTCQIFTAMVESASGESKKARNIVYNSIRDVITLYVKIIPVYVTETDVADSILKFLSICVKGLKIQMGATTVEELIASLLNHLKRDQMIVEVVKCNNSSGINTIEIFLKMLEMIVQEPDPSFKSLLPQVISFGLDHMLPTLNEDSVPDLRLSTLELFHQVLFHNWRYFFKSNVISRMSGEDQLQNDEQFLAVLKVFGQPLVENDIRLFRKSIEILESLNSKYRLYEKSIFQSTMLYSFLQVLLNVLIQKSHDLLQEEIINAVFSMVSSNFDAFFLQFIPNFLMNISLLTDHQRTQLHENYERHQDIPSFTVSLQQFTGDIRYLQNINCSLPPGTIQF